MSTIRDYVVVGGSKECDTTTTTLKTSQPANVLRPPQGNNLDKQIMENMESVIKSLKRKKKHKRHRNKKVNKAPGNQSDDDEPLSSWLTTRKEPEPSKSGNGDSRSSAEHPTDKKNAFHMLMCNGRGDQANNDENQAGKVSPENGKRKSVSSNKDSGKRRKSKTGETKSGDSPKSPAKKRRKKKLFECYVETVEPRTSQPEPEEVKTAEERIEILVVDSPSATRPRRSCATAISYIDTSPVSSKKAPTKQISTPKIGKPIDEENKESIIIDVEAEVVSVESTPKSTKKLAPMFVKAVPKPTVDPKVLEARQSFLKSDIPDKMRQEMEKKKMTQEEVNSRQLCFFPEVSHVPRVCGQLYLADYDELKLFPREDPHGPSSDAITQSPYSLPDFLQTKRDVVRPEVEPRPSPMTIVRSESQKKQLVRSLKTNNDATLPSNAFFKMLSARTTNPGSDSMLFSESFKPSNAKEFVFNLSVIGELREFLESFSNSAGDTGSSYETDDDECSNSMDAFSHAGRPTAVLYGPSSTGKTSAVYAMANEMNCNVIEINASSKRNGAKVLHKLLEATQSHKVPTAKMSLSRKVLRRMEREEKRMSIILIEDVDLIFADDNGFLAAITQLMSLTKRPIILTTNDRNSPALKKMFDSGPSFKFLHFRGPNRPWDCVTFLRLVGIVNGCDIDTKFIHQLFKECNGDLRRALLQLSFIALTKEVQLPWGEPLEQETEKQPEIPCFQPEGMDLEELAWTFDSLAVADTWTRRSEEDFGASELFSEISSLSQCHLGISGTQSTTMTYKTVRFDGSMSLTNNIARGAASRALKPLALDMEPTLRNICRSESARKDSQRASSKFTHYLLRERECEFLHLIGTDRSRKEDLELLRKSCSIFESNSDESPCS